MGRVHTRKPESNDHSASDALPATSGDGDSGLPNCKVYNEGELVLARYSSRFYEAEGWRRRRIYQSKALDHPVGTNGLELICYWKLMKENLLTKRLLDDQHNTEKNVRHVRTLPNNGHNGASGKKQKNHPSYSDDKRRTKHSIDKGKYIAPGEKLVNITIPLTLKKKLMDDHEFIVHLGKDI